MPEPGPYVISTLRFCNSRTPSAVGTAGLDSPNASLVTRASGTPRSVMYARTEALRRSDRPMLYLGVPERSVWPARSEEPTSELQSLMLHSYAGFCLKKKISNHN